MDARTTRHAWKIEKKQDQKTQCNHQLDAYTNRGGARFCDFRCDGEDRASKEVGHRNFRNHHPIWFRDLCLSWTITSVVTVGIARDLSHSPCPGDMGFLPIRFVQFSEF